MIDTDVLRTAAKGDCVGFRKRSGGTALHGDSGEANFCRRRGVGVDAEETICAVEIVDDDGLVSTTRGGLVSSAHDRQIRAASRHSERRACGPPYASRTGRNGKRSGSRYNRIEGCLNISL